MAEIRIEGLEKLDKALKTLPSNVARKVIDSANGSGAGVIRTQARRNLVQKIKEIDDGTAETLKGIVSRKTDKGPFTVEHSVGAITREFNVNFIETGTAPHVIRTDKPGGLGSGNRFFGRSVFHPGQRMNPWLRPAFDNKKTKAVMKIGERLWAGIKREAAKLR